MKKNQWQRERPRENLLIKHVKWRDTSSNVICVRTRPHPLPEAQAVTLRLRAGGKGIGREMAVPWDLSDAEHSSQQQARLHILWQLKRDENSTALHRGSSSWSHKLSSEDVTLSPPPTTRHSIPPLKPRSDSLRLGGLPVWAQPLLSPGFWVSPEPLQYWHMPLVSQS